MEIFTDGFAFGKPRAKAGYGIFFGRKDPRNLSEPVPPELPQTNNAAELLAIVQALKIVCPSDRPVNIYSDSTYCI